MGIEWFLVITLIGHPYSSIHKTDSKTLEDCLRLAKVTELVSVKNGHPMTVTCATNGEERKEYHTSDRSSSAESLEIDILTRLTQRRS